MEEYSLDVIPDTTTVWIDNAVNLSGVASAFPIPPEPAGCRRCRPTGRRAMAIGQLLISEPSPECGRRGRRFGETVVLGSRGWKSRGESRDG